MTKNNAKDFDQRMRNLMYGSVEDEEFDKRMRRLMYGETYEETPEQTGKTTPVTLPESYSSDEGQDYLNDLDLFGQGSAGLSPVMRDTPPPVTKPVTPPVITPPVAEAGVKTPTPEPKPLPKGLITEGNLDLNKRPVVPRDDGKISTVNSITVGFDDGFYVIPTVTEEGLLLDNDQAVEYFKKTGKHLGRFHDQETADAFARKLHLDQEKMYGGQGKTKSPGIFTELVEKSNNYEASTPYVRGQEMGGPNTRLNLLDALPIGYRDPLDLGLGKAISNIVPTYQSIAGAEDFGNALGMRFAIEDAYAGKDEPLVSTRDVGLDLDDNLKLAQLRLALKAGDMEEANRLKTELEESARNLEEMSKTRRDWAERNRVNYEPAQDGILKYIQSGIENTGFSGISRLRSAPAWILGGPALGAMMSMYNASREGAGERGEKALSILKENPNATRKELEPGMEGVMGGNLALLTVSEILGDTLFLSGVWPMIGGGKALDGPGAIKAAGRFLFNKGLPYISQLMTEYPEEFGQQLLQQLAGRGLSFSDMWKLADVAKAHEAGLHGIAGAVVSGAGGVVARPLLDSVRQGMSSRGNENPDVLPAEVGGADEVLKHLKDLGFDLDLADIQAGGAPTDGGGGGGGGGLLHTIINELSKTNPQLAQDVLEASRTMTPEEASEAAGILREQINNNQNETDVIDQGAVETEAPKQSDNQGATNTTVATEKVVKNLSDAYASGYVDDAQLNEAGGTLDAQLGLTPGTTASNIRAGLASQSTVTPSDPTVPVAESGETSAKPAEPKLTRAQKIVQKLKESQGRGDALAILGNRKGEFLSEIAGELGIPVDPSDTPATLRNKIIESTAGENARALAERAQRRIQEQQGQGVNVIPPSGRAGPSPTQNFPLQGTPEQDIQPPAPPVQEQQGQVPEVQKPDTVDSGENPYDDYDSSGDGFVVQTTSQKMKPGVRNIYEEGRVDFETGERKMYEDTGKVDGIGKRVLRAEDGSEIHVSNEEIDQKFRVDPTVQTQGAQSVQEQREEQQPEIAREITEQPIEQGTAEATEETVEETVEEDPDYPEITELRSASDRKGAHKVAKKISKPRLREVAERLGIEINDKKDTVNTLRDRIVEVISGEREAQTPDVGTEQGTTETPTQAPVVGETTQDQTDPEFPEIDDLKNANDEKEAGERAKSIRKPRLAAVAERLGLQVDKEKDTVNTLRKRIVDAIYGRSEDSDVESAPAQAQPTANEDVSVAETTDQGESAPVQEPAPIQTPVPKQKKGKSLGNVPDMTGGPVQETTQPKGEGLVIPGEKRLGDQVTAPSQDLSGKVDRAQLSKAKTEDSAPTSEAVNESLKDEIDQIIDEIRNAPADKESRLAVLGKKTKKQLKAVSERLGVTMPDSWKAPMMKDAILDLVHPPKKTVQAMDTSVYKGRLETQETTHAPEAKAEPTPAPVKAETPSQVKAVAEKINNAKSRGEVKQNLEGLKKKELVAVAKELGVVFGGSDTINTLKETIEAQTIGVREQARTFRDIDLRSDIEKLGEDNTPAKDNKVPEVKAPSLPESRGDTAITKTQETKKPSTKYRTAEEIKRDADSIDEANKANVTEFDEKAEPKEEKSEPKVENKTEEKTEPEVKSEPKSKAEESNPEEVESKEKQSKEKRAEPDIELNKRITFATLKKAFPKERVFNLGKGVFRIVGRNGQTAHLVLAKRVDIDPVAYERENGKPPTQEMLDAGALGSTTRLVDGTTLIQIAADMTMTAENINDRFKLINKETGKTVETTRGIEMVRTIFHESYHAASDMVLSNKEKSILSERYGNEEAQADAYMDWLLRREMKSTTGRIFQRIFDFFSRVRSSLLGPDSESVFVNINRGQAWARESGAKKGDTSYRIQGSLRLDDESLSPKDKELLQKMDEYINWEPQRTKDGKILGAPEWVKTDKDLKKLRKLLKQFVDEGISARYWYEDSGLEVLRMVGGNVEDAAMFTQILAIYSPKNKVDNNTTAAIKAWNMYKRGVPESEFHVATSVQDQKAKNVLYHGDKWEGRKTGSFYSNLMFEILKDNPELAESLGIDTDKLKATIDLWMYRAFGYINEQGSNDQKYGRYTFAESSLIRLAAELNRGRKPGEPIWTPHQVQAAIWTAMKTRYENALVKKSTNELGLKQGIITMKDGKPVYPKEGTPERKQHLQNWREFALEIPDSAWVKEEAERTGVSFAEYIKRMTEHITLEVIPSSKFNAEINNASAEARRAFTERVMGEIILDENGNDQIAQLLDVPISRVEIGDGAYAGGVNPNIIASLTPDKAREYDSQGNPKTTLAFNHDNARAYAKIVQYVFKQDAVPWFNPNFVPLSKMATEDQKFKVVTTRNGKQNTVKRFDTLSEAEAYIAEKGTSEHSIVGGDKAHAVMLSFSDDLTGEKLDSLLRLLETKFGESAGFTKMSDREVAIINFRDDETKIPFLDDKVFFDSLSSIKENLNSLGVTTVDQFYSEGEYGYVHDWEADNTGSAILDSDLLRERSDIQERVHVWRNVFEELLKEFSGENLRNLEETLNNRGGVRGSGPEDSTGKGTKYRVGVATQTTESPFTVEPDGSVRLFHWGNQSGLTSLDPSKHGTGIRGAESKRRENDPKNYVPRIYFGMNEGGYVKEPRLSNNKYEASVKLDELYDFTSDPEGFLEKGYEKAGPYAHDDAITYAERLISEAGYKGLWVNTRRDQNRSVAVLFTPTEVKSVPYSEESTNPEGGTPKYRIAFHGSPFRFARFSTKHIGTGEGYQAYGWGLYFAEKKSVAETYRKKLSTNRVEVLLNGKEMKLTNNTPPEVYDAYSLLRDSYVQKLAGTKDPAGIAKWAIQKFPPLRAGGEWILEHVKDGSLEVTTKNDGQLYEVDIPEDNELLDLDKPLKEQPKEVRDMVEKALAGFRKAQADRYFAIHGENAEESVMDIGEMTGNDVKADLYMELGDEKESSLYLKKFGIKGFKYFDAGSRSIGEGTHNFVVFDDNAIEMVKTYYRMRPGMVDSGHVVTTERLKESVPGAKVFKTPGKVSILKLKNGEFLAIDSNQEVPIGRSVRLSELGENITIKDIDSEFIEAIDASTFVAIVDGMTSPDEAPDGLFELGTQIGLTYEDVETIDKAIGGPDSQFKMYKEFLETGNAPAEVKPIFQALRDYYTKIRNKLFGNKSASVFKDIHLEGVMERFGLDEQKLSPRKRAEYRNRLNRDMKTFSNRVDSYLKYVGMSTGDEGLVDVMTTPLALELVRKQMGLGDEKLLPIKIDFKKLGKILVGKHADSITPELLKQIPEKIADPIMILRLKPEGQRLDNSLLFVLGLQDKNGYTVNVAIAMDMTREGSEINEIKTVFGRGYETSGIAGGNKFFISEALRKDPRSGSLSLNSFRGENGWETKLKYIDTEQARMWADQYGLDTEIEHIFWLMNEHNNLHENRKVATQYDLEGARKKHGNTKYRTQPQAWENTVSKFGLEGKVDPLHKKQGVKDKIKGAWRWWKYEVLDRRLKIRDVFGNDIYMSVTNALDGISSKSEALITFGEKKKGVKSLYDIFGQVSKDEQDGFMHYAIYKHLQDIARNTEHAMVSADAIDLLVKEEMDKARAFEKITPADPIEKSNLDHNAKLHRENAELYRKQAEEVRKQIHDTRGKSDDYRMAVEELEKEYPHWVQAQKDLAKFSRYLLWKLKNSDIISDSLFNVLVTRYPNYVPLQRDFGEEGAMESFVKSRGIVNITSPLKKLKGSRRDVKDPLLQIVSNVYTFESLTARQDAGKRIVDMYDNGEFKDIIEEVGDKRGSPTEHVFHVWEGGKKRYFKTDADIYAGLMMNSKSGDQTGLMKILSAPVRALRAGVTHGVGFILRNPLRDTVNAGVVGENFVPIVDTLRGMFHILKQDKIFEDFMKSGAAQGMAYMSSKTQEEMAKRIRIGRGSKRLMENLKPWNTPMAIWNFLGDVAQFTELGTRVGQYQAVKRKGGTDERAAYVARDLVNYQRSGNVSQAISKVNPFFNAQIQGVAKGLRSIYHDGKIDAKTLAKGLLYITLPSMLSVAWNLGDDDRKKKYLSIPNWQRNLFWNIVLGEGDDTWVLKIPKPFDLGVVFGSIPERFMDYLYAEDERAFNQMGESLVQAVSPETVPLFLGLPLELMTNYSLFFERNIVPMGQEKLEPRLQYGAYTAEWAKWAGDKFNISPRKLEYGVNQLTGNFGKEVSNLADKAFRLVSNETRPAREWYQEVPGVSAFAVPAKAMKRWEQTFRDERDELDVALRSAKEVLKTKGRKGLGVEDRRVLGAEGGISRINKYFTGKGGINEIYREINRITVAKGMSAEQKRRRVDALQRKIAQLSERGLKETERIKRVLNKK